MHEEEKEIKTEDGLESLSIIDDDDSENDTTKVEILSDNLWIVRVK